MNFRINIMKKLVVFGLALIGFVVSKSQAQTISTLPLSNNSICEGETFNISYSVNGVFNAGNSFTAELSDNTGSFAAACCYWFHFVNKLRKY